MNTNRKNIKNSVFNRGDLKINEYHYDKKYTSIISLDLEGDYNGSEQEGINHLDIFLKLLKSMNVPITVYVEGRLFKERPRICDSLVQNDLDIQLHCYDHRNRGDSIEDIYKGIEAYKSFMGKKPMGYRAFGFKLNDELFDILIKEEFKWDSSLLPGFGLGGHIKWANRIGDYYKINNKILEFPVATWKKINYPMIQSYRGMLKFPLENLFNLFFLKPSLLVYVIHMVDVVWTKNLSRSPLPIFLKIAYYYYWGLSRGNKFKDLTKFLNQLQQEGYEFKTTYEIFKLHNKKY